TDEIIIRILALWRDHPMRQPPQFSDLRADASFEPIDVSRQNPTKHRRLPHSGAGEIRIRSAKTPVKRMIRQWLRFIALQIVDPKLPLRHRPPGPVDRRNYH